jgi:hypothetical protein
MLTGSAAGNPIYGYTANPSASEKMGMQIVTHAYTPTFSNPQYENYGDRYNHKVRDITSKVYQLERHEFVWGVCKCGATTAGDTPGTVTVSSPASGASINSGNAIPLSGSLRGGGVSRVMAGLLNAGGEPVRTYSSANGEISFNASSGSFSGSLSTSGVPAGTYTLAVVGLDSSGRAVTEEDWRTITIAGSSIPSPRGNMDEPKHDSAHSGSMKVRGWAVHTTDGRTDGISKIQVYLDDVHKGDAARSFRPDIQMAIPGYGDYSKSGYEYTLSLAPLSAGTHSVTVRALDKSSREVWGAYRTFRVK